MFKASLWVESVGTFEADDDGNILVPFGEKIQNLNCVLSAADKAHIFAFSRRAMRHELKLSCFISPEALVQGNRQVQVRESPAFLYIYTHKALPKPRFQAKN